MTYFANPPESICVLRLSAIGDVCNAVSMVQAIQRHWPACKLTWVVGRAEASLLEGLPGVELLVFDKSQGINGYKQLRQAMRGRKFDVLLHMQVALRASLASLCISARYRIGFDKQRAKEGQWLFTNRRIKQQQHPHVLEGFKAFARALGLPDYQPQWQLPIPAEAQAWAEGQFPCSERSIVICPASSLAYKNWSPEGYAAVARHAHQRGYRIVLCGGPAPIERQLGEAIQAEAKDIPMLNLIGETSLKQLLAMLKRTCLVISPDSGPAHMANAIGTPVLGLYAHNNPRRTAPYLFKHYVVSIYDQSIEQQRGKSWEQLPWDTRAKGDDLMRQLPVEDVLAMFDKILEREVQVGDYCGTSCHRPLNHLAPDEFRSRTAGDTTPPL